MGDQCSRILWVTFTHEFTFPQNLKQSNDCPTLICNNSYPWIDVPVNQQNFDKPWTLAPMNKKLFHSICTYFKVIKEKNVVSIKNFRNLHISELWLILVYVATKQIGEQRLKAIQLLLRILETQNRYIKWDWENSYVWISQFDRIDK